MVESVAEVLVVWFFFIFFFVEMASEIRVCFKSQDESKDYFRVSEQTNIQRLLHNYCKKRSLEYGTVTFLYDGKNLRRRGTVSQVGLVDQAEIEVMLNMSGGGASNGSNM